MDCSKALPACGQKANKKVPYTLPKLKQAFNDYYERPVPRSAVNRENEVPQLGRRPGIRRYICYHIQSDPGFCHYIKTNVSAYQWKGPQLSLRRVCRSGVCDRYHAVECPLSVSDLFRLWGRAGGQRPSAQAMRKKGGQRKWLISELRAGRGDIGRRFCTLVARLLKPAIVYPSLDLPFSEFQKKISELFEAYRYPVPTLENGCLRDPKKLVEYAPHQKFVRHYMTPRSPNKGLLMWHDVGTGKTCGAIAILSHNFEFEDYNVLWVTRRKIQDAPLKAMFRLLCHKMIREMVRLEKEAPVDEKLLEQFQNSSKKDWDSYIQKTYVKWGPVKKGKGNQKRVLGSVNRRNLTYREFQNLFDPRYTTRRKEYGINLKGDPLKKTLVVIDEAHNLYNVSDLPQTERVTNIRRIENAIQNSYQKSGKDSVRVLLLTATPILNDPSSLSKLINLLGPRQPMPLTFGELDKLSLEDFQNKSKGLISYLSGSRDVRYFAQKELMPVINVHVSELQEKLLARCLKKKTDAEKLKCVRPAANFGAGRVPSKFIIDSPHYSKTAAQKDIWKYMPKARTLLDKIKELDEADQVNFGTTYKHIVYTDVQQQGLGTKVLASAFIADGWQICRYHKHSAGRSASFSLEIPANNVNKKTFAFLSSSSVKGDKVFVPPAPKSPPDQPLRNKIAAGVKDDFNRRPNNVYGENCRVLLLDSGFKEGIDVFDVKYIHLLEPPLSRSSLVQAVGRGVRRCGQMGLPYDPNNGWKVNVIVYRSKQAANDNEFVFDLELQLNPMKENTKLIDRLQNYSIVSAVDYDLNKNIIEYTPAGIKDAILAAQEELKIP